MQKQIEQKLDSREVAKMMGKDHYEIIRMIDGDSKRKIVGILPTLVNGRITVSDYFQESEYVTSNNNRHYKCYQITKMGCEMLGNKLTGEKGILFTAKYVERFNKMEQQLQLQAPSIDIANQMLGLAQSTQMMAQVVQGIQGAIGGIQTYVQDSIQAKDRQIDDIAELVGLRSKNVQVLTGTLKRVIATKYKVLNVNASMDIYKKAKSKIFNEFNVRKWEDIPVGKYATVQAFIEEVI